MCFEPAVLTRSSYELPSGCPVVVAVSADHLTFAPVVTTLRNNIPVDVTGPVTTSSTLVTNVLSESVGRNGSGCSINSAYVELPFDVHTISIAGAGQNEQLLVGGTSVAVVSAPGPCPPAIPLDPYELECRVTHQQYWDCTCEVRPDAWECGGGHDDPPPSDSGCAAGSPGLAVMLFAFALLRRRRLIQA